MKFTDDIPNVCCVYKITNTINNRILIGSTKNLRNRINHYRNDIKKDNPLKHYNRLFLQDVVDFGLFSFTVDIIEEFNENITDKELKNKETEYILKFNSINPSIGYNIRLDVDGKYICNDSTRDLKSKQLKEQWSKGVRKNHSNLMKEYWKNNADRREKQGGLFSKYLTKYVYNIYKNNELIKEHILYTELVDMGLASAIQYFAKEDKLINKNNNSIIRKITKIVYCKDYKVERIIAKILKI